MNEYHCLCCGRLNQICDGTYGAWYSEENLDENNEPTGSFDLTLPVALFGPTFFDQYQHLYPKAFYFDAINEYTSGWSIIYDMPACDCAEPEECTCWPMGPFLNGTRCTKSNNDWMAGFVYNNGAWELAYA